MKKIVLVQPKVGELEFIQGVPMLPLALLQVSAGLADQYAVKIIDQRVDPDWKSTLKNELSGNVLCAGITVMTGPQISYALEASRIIKENSAVPVAWGGIHPTLLPEQTLEHPYVDIVVTGEGEILFRDLIYSMDSVKEWQSLPGIWTKRNGRPYGTPPEEIDDINKLPPLPYNLIRVEDYVSRDRDGRKKIHIQTARGCPYQCTFCYQSGKYRKKWRAFGAERVMAEIKKLRTGYNIGHFHIIDDNFFADMSRAHSILKSIADEKREIVITINGARISDILTMKEETLRLLSDKRFCYELQIGLESGSDIILDKMKKGVTRTQIFEANERLRKFNIPRYYELVTGFKGETEEDIKQTAGVILSLSEKDDNVFFSPMHSLSPYPGTEVYREAEADGMKFPQNLSGWSEYKWDAVRLPWIDNKTKRLMEAFFIFPILVSRRNKYARSLLLLFLMNFLRPLARFRLKKFYFGLAFEAVLFKIFIRLKNK